MKKNNSGFSLVELIIVIAIMAVLIGVLAPQFIKYVESSRKSTDIQNVAEIITAIDTYCADPDNTASSVAGAITLKSGASTDVAASPASGPEVALKSAAIGSYGLKSKEWGSGDLTFTVTVTDGVPSYAVTGQKTGLDIIKGIKVPVTP